MVVVKPEMIKMAGIHVPANPLDIDGVKANCSLDNSDVYPHKLEWEATLRVPHPDILVVQEGMPFLEQLWREAEKRNEWHNCATVTKEGEGKVTKDRTSDWCDVRVEGPLGNYAQLLHVYEATFLKYYFFHINPFAKVERGSGWELLRYKTGQEFKEHIDTGNYKDAWAKIQLSDEMGVVTQRRLSAIAFCNNDFKGGQLVFRRQRLVLNPSGEDVSSEYAGYTVLGAPPGTLVLWPSGVAFPHQALPVTAGTRYSVVTWFF